MFHIYITIKGAQHLETTFTSHFSQNNHNQPHRYTEKRPCEHIIPETYEELIRYVYRVTPPPQIKKIHSNGQSVKAIYGIRKNQDYLPYTYILKHIRMFRKRTQKLHNIYEDTESWAHEMIFRTTPKQEIENLLCILSDEKIRAWCKSQMKIHKSHLLRKLTDYLFGPYTLHIGFAEKVYLLEDKTAISILHGARGISLYNFLVQNRHNKEKSGIIMVQLGMRMAEFHLKTKKAHLDFHASNIFISEKYQKFTLIDNHSLAYTQAYENDPDALSMLFGNDCTYLLHTFRIWYQAGSSQLNIADYVYLYDNFDAGYCFRFKQLNTEGQYKIIRKI